VVAAPAASLAGTYLNPVFPSSGFADPMVLDRDGRHSDYYGYATGDRFPVLRSSDLVHWQALAPAMRERPSWVTKNKDWHPWAPSVLQTEQPCPGSESAPCFVMYYVGLNTSLVPSADCIGVATSPRPEGPFEDRGPLQDAAGSVDQSGRPIGCGDDRGYSNIDPAPFVDSDGTAYLYLSAMHSCDAAVPNGTCPDTRAISVVPLSADRLRAAGPRLALFGGGAAWEQAPWASVVENPWMHKRGSRYYLFYSGGDWTARYGMGYATSSSPTGPFAKAAVNPIIEDTANVKSAGGGSLAVGPRGGDWLAYHGRAGSLSEPRTLRIDRIGWSADGTVSVDGPSTTRRSPVP
jgi:beta-xylosidase